VAKDTLDGAGRPTAAPWQVANDAAGLSALVTQLAPMAPALVGLEATGGFAGPLLAALAVAAMPVVRTNPRQVRAFAHCQSVIESVPVDTRRFHGDQEPLTPVFDQMIPQSLFKTAETLSGVGKLQLATAYGGLRA
jgi:hypothetical protein